MSLICSDASRSIPDSSGVNLVVQQPVSDIDLDADQNVEAAGWCDFQYVIIVMRKSSQLLCRCGKKTICVDCN